MRHQRAFPLLAVAVVLLGCGPARADFPPGFLWGTANSGFQSEMDLTPASIDAGSDWYVWTHDGDNIANEWVSGDLPESGPGFYTRYEDDVHLAAKRLRSTTFRMSIEWSRIFPTSTAGVDTSGGITSAVIQQLDALADPAAVAHYRAVLEAVRLERMIPFVTLLHFALPTWVHDPIAARDALAGTDPNAPVALGFGPAGWLDPATVTEFEKYAAYVAWRFGDLVDLYSPLNEPVVVASSGYVNLPGVLTAYFPPGAYTFTGVVDVLTNEIEGHAAAYDAIKTWDTYDADTGPEKAAVGVVHNMAAFHPKRSTNADDIAGAQHADYIFNRLFLNAVILGQTDLNVNGTIEPGENRPDLVGKADFVGVNYYLKSRVFGIGAALTPVIPLLDFQPTISYSTPEHNTGGSCPTSCTEFGWEIYPKGLREVLTIAGGYGLPVYITENGIADSNDDERKSYLARHLIELDEAIHDGVADVRGYYYWSLLDNFEWAAGLYPQFGLFRYDPVTLARKRRPSSGVLRRTTRDNAVPAGLVRRYGG